MNGIEKKLKVLSDIAHALNARHVVWAVGASALLYFKGKTDSFHDIDLMVKESDAETAKEQLLQLGSLLPPEPNTQYQTRCFLEFEINGVDVDMMAGFVINALAIATRCCCPPESSKGLWFMRSFNPTRSNMAAAISLWLLPLSLR